MPGTTKPRKPKQSKLPPESEADVTRACLDVFKMFGLDMQRQNTGGAYYPDGNGGQRYVQFGEVGNCDWTGMHPRDGRRIDVEIKRPGERPTPDQLARMLSINAKGGVALWVWDARQLLHALGRVLEGWRVEMDERGNYSVTDEGR